MHLITTNESRFRQNRLNRASNSNMALDLDYDFAFQPIVDSRNRSTFAHEALVRGVNGSGAASVLSQVTDSHQFDQDSRTKAIHAAIEANLTGALAINFMPNAVHNPGESIHSTLAACAQYTLPTEDIIFEFNEQDLVKDPAHIARIGQEYKRKGFRTAIDDFGAGYSGLNFIANFQPDIIKIDMGLIRDIDASHSRQTIIKTIVRMCYDFNITIIAEGVETAAERDTLESYGIHLFQGFLFCEPRFKAQGIINQAAWH